jgi:hypothetical protein
MLTFSDNYLKVKLGLFELRGKLPYFFIFILFSFQRMSYIFKTFKKKRFCIIGDEYINVCTASNNI